MSSFLNYGPNRSAKSEADDKPHAFIQWKGTDVCMDFYCECGEHNHFDGLFAYVVACAKCGQEWEMPSNIYPRKRCDDTFEGHQAVQMEGDDEPNP